MGLQCERPARGVGRQVAFSSMIVCGMVILLHFISAIAGESLSRPFTSRKQIEAEKNGEQVQLKDWVSPYGESTWKAISSQVIRLWSSDDYTWPELELGARTISAILLAALAAAVSAAAGLGGGILYVPLLQLVLQFNSKTSIAMSNFMMFGGTAAGVALNLMRDHPTEFNKPLVDFDIALLLQPNMLLGISIGVLLNNMLPIWLITLFLVVMLVYTTYSTTKIALKRWDNETQLANAKKNPKKKTLRRSSTESEKALTEHLLGFYQSVSSRYPVKSILALVFVWVVLFFLQILKGGYGRQGLLNVTECGVSYWVLTASQIPLVFGVTAWNICHLRAATAEATEAGTSDSQDQGYTLGPRESTFFSGVAVLAGLVAGMLGIGGAMIINPLLLSVGVLPQVTTATSLFMMFFSSSMSAAQYWLMGYIPVGYALIAALICAVSSTVGIVGLQKIVNRYGRPSIVFVIAGVMGFSVITMSTYGTLDVWNQFKSGADMGFSTPC